MLYFIEQPYSPFALQVSTFGTQLTNALAASLGFTIAERDAAIDKIQSHLLVARCGSGTRERCGEYYCCRKIK